MPLLTAAHRPANGTDLELLSPVGGAVEDVERRAPGLGPVIGLAVGVVGAAQVDSILGFLADLLSGNEVAAG